MLRDDIVACLEAMGLQTTAAQLDALVIHATMLVEANTHMNLTRITRDEDVALLHVADSLTILPFLRSAPPGAFADLGSGGGYPGIPLGIMSGRHLTLVESRGKKAEFLQGVIDEIGLDADVRPLRAEELAVTERGAYAAVVARALAPLESLVELAAPLLERGGVLIAMKGLPGVEELDTGDAAGAVVGLKRTGTVGVELPAAAAAERTVVSYVSVAASKILLPRRPGMAQRHPLA